MPNAETVSLAIQYATKMRKMNLAQRLGELSRRKAREHEERLNDQPSDFDDDEYDDDDDENNYRQPPMPLPSRGPSNSR